MAETDPGRYEMLQLYDKKKDGCLTEEQQMKTTLALMEMNNNE